ncbi:histidine phosphatase family protein [Alloscardovia venturai]|uniref:Histidine phosphatase family protein n=1 Tax=Alloscardovia venturai TaxID=1769421 RepID=A0ABW2Y4F7_9BIFI
MNNQGRLILLRHGQTVWSVSGQYTGRTNIPLTAEGEEQAVAAGQRLRGYGIDPRSCDKSHVFVSPLRRAQRTAQIAGFSQVTTLDELAEWDYGGAEGRTRAQVAEVLGISTWNVWETGPHELPESLWGTRSEYFENYGDIEIINGKGESVEEAAARTRRVIDKALPYIMAGEDVVCVAHAHILRILTTQWLGLDPHCARMFVLDTAHFSILSMYRDDKVIAGWNQ